MNNRIYKFRAWLKADKKMFPVWGIKFLTKDKTAWISLPTWGEDKDYNDFLLKDVELMQYTGLTDKNGKEIYEGDIVKHRIGFCGTDFKEVIFKDGGFTLNGYEREFSNRMATFEIIGNVWENKDLFNCY